jgi:hypothetical protein
MALVPFPQGRHVVSTLLRDLTLPPLMAAVAEGTGMSVTRSPANPSPSIAVLTSLALAARGAKLSERQG